MTGHLIAGALLLKKGCTLAAVRARDRAAGVEVQPDGRQLGRGLDGRFVISTGRVLVPRACQKTNCSATSLFSQPLGE